MRNLLFVAIAIVLSINLQAKNLKPYILGAESSKSLSEVKKLVKINLKAKGFKVLGEYSPAKDAKRWVLVVNNTDLTNAVKKVKGLTGFASTLRVALTLEGKIVKVSYTNPYYWGNAYFRDDYPKVESYYKSFSNKMIGVMKKSGTYKGTSFGSKNGVSIDDLRDYQYMFGMPDFDDVVELEDFDSFKAAKAKVEANLRKGIAGLKLVYSYQIPGTQLKVYGIALTANDGEKEFLPIIDLGKPKHTAFLPYEILVNGKDVVMLHGRYRIALSFPDLAMSTFSKIMSTPGYIEDMMEKTCK